MNKIITKRKSRISIKQNNPLITISNIIKHHSGESCNAVDNITFSVEKGDLFVLVGPSGCGKSTLLRMIAGFETPTSGSILLDGQDITKLPPYERPINMMFQSYALFPHMNVEQNIAFGLKQEKELTKQEIQIRVNEALDMVSMSHLSYRKPDQLSGGQKQRVALARSLVKRPKLLLLDEPLGALDRQTREKTKIELIKIQYMLDTTFIMVTHHQEDAMTMADQMAVMKDGKVLQIGSAEDIYEFPNSKFVADFVDSINLFRGIVVQDRNLKGLFGIQIEESDEVIFARTKEDLLINQTVWLGVRPEEAEIDIKTAPKDENHVEGKIIDYAFLGHKIVYHVELKNQKNIHVTVPTSERARNPNFIPGRKVYISWYYTDGALLTH